MHIALVIVQLTVGLADDIAAALRLNEELDFQGAARQLEVILERRELEREDALAALYGLALAQIALHRTDAAVRTFTRMLVLDPELDPGSDASPRVLEVYRQARRRQRTSAGSAGPNAALGAAGGAAAERAPEMDPPALVKITSRPTAPSSRSVSDAASTLVPEQVTALDAGATAARPTASGPRPLALLEYAGLASAVAGVGAMLAGAYYVAEGYSLYRTITPGDALTQREAVSRHEHARALSRRGQGLLGAGGVLLVPAAYVAATYAF